MTIFDKWLAFKRTVFRNPIDYPNGWGVASIIGFAAVLGGLTLLAGHATIAAPVFCVTMVAIMMTAFICKECPRGIERYIKRPFRNIFLSDVMEMKKWKYWISYIGVVIFCNIWYSTLGLNLQVFNEFPFWFIGPAMMTMYSFLLLIAADHFAVSSKIKGWFSRQYYRHIKKTFSMEDYVTTQADDDTESYLDRLGVYDSMGKSCCQLRKMSRELTTARGNERERLMEEMLEEMERGRRRGWDTEDDHH